MATSLQPVADGVHLASLAPLSMFNSVVLDGPDGDIVIDSGPAWSGKRLARLLRGRDVGRHVVTHAHGDHVGSSAWLCSHTGAPLAMSELEADDFERGSIAYHAGLSGRLIVPRMTRQRHHVDQRLTEGDQVGSFTVLPQPGHSPGLLAFWRESDRVLIVGDGPTNISNDPTSPRWMKLPVSWHHDPAGAVESRRHLAELEPELIVSTHGRPVRGVDRWLDGIRNHAH
ncbi:MBL fold metallo-hydrolase [Arsenicicoccus bolidensis]|uniref:MBL fold metallo-hydrolase n=1 Tax=Arsenicicoccus bolidensis TaxID=229480 RepID=UPI000492A93A|nr:MBL fold metallo-hydrolase [Arsenicicoccus bolidensis]